MYPTVDTYLTTFRRIPDDVILAVATREFEMLNPDKCLVGWVVREGIAARDRADDAENVDPYTGRTTITAKAPELFGGDEQEWMSIFIDVLHTPTYNSIEEAFALRVEEAVGA